MDEVKVIDLARKKAKDLISEFYLTGANSEIIWDNPFENDTPENELYDGYMEHYIMSGLGY